MERSETALLLPTAGSFEGTPSIGYVCPLYTELVAVLATFDEYLGREERDQDEYYYGRIGGRMVVAAHFLHREMGPQAASRLAEKMLKVHPTLRQSRSICLLVGIAGGIWTKDRDVRLGDAVIATQIWNWRDGKLTEGGLKATGFPKDASRRLLQRLPSFLYHRDTLAQSVADRLKLMRERDRTNDLRWTHPGNQHDRLYLQTYAHISGSSCATHDSSQTVTRFQRGNDLPVVHDGLIASGNVVLKDAKSRDLLHEKGVYAVEMEACGVPEEFLVVRGISDYADSHKNDIWHAYAAAVAAACSRLLIDNIIDNDNQDSARLHRFRSCPSEVPSLSKVQEASSSFSTSVRKDNELALQPPLRRAPKTDPVLPAAHHLSTPASKIRSGPLPVTRQTPVQLPSRLIPHSAENLLSTSVLPGAKSIARDIASTSGGSQVDESVSGMFQTSTLSEAAAHSAPWPLRKPCYSATYEFVSFQLRGRTGTISPEVTREHWWTKPTVTVVLQNADSTSAEFAPACFLILTSDEVGTGREDRLWLPLSGLRINNFEGDIHISYQSMVEEGVFLDLSDSLDPESIEYELIRWYESARTTSVSPASGSPGEVVLILHPQTSGSGSSDSLVESLLSACRSLVSTDPPRNIFSDEVVHSATMKGIGAAQNVLYVHQVDARRGHYCTVRAFSRELDFTMNWLPSHVEVSLKQMRCVQYTDSTALIALGVKRSATIPPIKVRWIRSPEPDKICRDIAPNCMETLLDETIGKMAGWTAISATEGVTLTSLHNRNANRLQSSFISKATAVVYRKTSSNCILTAWKRGEYIRFFLGLVTKSTHPEDGFCDEWTIWDEWTIKAGQGEIFLGRDHNSKLKVAFEFDTPSRSGETICMTTAKWFTLERSGRTCGDSISLKFPTSESYTKFKRSIDHSFWR